MMNNQRRALICEDDPAIRMLVRTVVQREGFQAEVAVDGLEAMEKLQSGCYDVVLLDLMMPGVDGYGIVEFIKSESAAGLQRVIVMTAATEAMRTDFPEPICTLLRKPFEISALTHALHSCTIDCHSEEAISA
jgi:two-component system, OmpR family, response regulator VanR